MQLYCHTWFYSIRFLFLKFTTSVAKLKDIVLYTWDLFTGFVLILGLKLQGLFKDIPGRNSNFSSTPSSKKCHENAILDDRV